MAPRENTCIYNVFITLGHPGPTFFAPRTGVRSREGSGPAFLLFLAPLVRKSDAEGSQRVSHVTPNVPKSPSGDLRKSMKNRLCGLGGCPDRNQRIVSHRGVPEHQGSTRRHPAVTRQLGGKMCFFICCSAKVVRAIFSLTALAVRVLVGFKGFKHPKPDAAVAVWFGPPAESRIRFGNVLAVLIRTARTKQYCLVTF